MSSLRAEPDSPPLVRAVHTWHSFSSLLSAAISSSRSAHSLTSISFCDSAYSSWELRIYCATSDSSENNWRSCFTALSNSFSTKVIWHHCCVRNWFGVRVVTQMGGCVVSSHYRRFDWRQLIQFISAQFIVNAPRPALLSQGVDYSLLHYWCAVISRDILEIFLCLFNCL